MIFTVYLATKFFCVPNQMGLANNVRFALDLAECRKNHWHQVVTNLKYPASLPDLDNNGQFIRAPMITLVANSLECLKVASEAAMYY